MSSPFRELGLASDLVAHLAAQGITEPSPIQAATMADLLAGRDVMAAAPTGSGKTVAFAAPLVDRLGKGSPFRPAALVLTPTRELAAQIHGVLMGLCRVRGRYASTVYGGVKQGPQVSYLRKGVDVLVACPGRLEDLIEQGFVHLDKVSMVVIDEADRMADMGFLPCVRRIVDQCRPERQTMLFSATLDGAADDLARSHLKDPARHAVAPKEEDHGKATHLFWTSSTDQRAQLSAEIIRKAGRTVVFTRTKHGADRLTEKLNAMGVQAAVIHGGCSQAARDRSLADFHRGRVAALVATDVAARGIHVEKVACVVHHDLPDSPTDYQHRSGRTARAGERGTVVSLVTPDQRRHAKNVQRHFGFPHGHTQPNLDHIEAGEVPVVVERVGGDRFERTDRPQRTDRPGYGRPRDDRPRDDRPAYARDDRPNRYGKGGPTPRSDRPGYARDDRPAYGRDDRPAAPRDARPAYGRPRDDRPPYARDDRPAYGRPRDDRPPYARDDRPAYSRDDRPNRTGGAPSSARPAGPGARRDDRTPYARDARPARPGGPNAAARDERPRTDRPNRFAGSNPAGRTDRPAPARYGDAPTGARPAGRPGPLKAKGKVYRAPRAGGPARTGR